MKSELRCNSRLLTLGSLRAQGYLLLMLGIFILFSFNFAQAKDKEQTSLLKQSINTQSLLLKNHESDLKQIEKEKKDCSKQISKINNDMLLLEKQAAIISTQTGKLEAEIEQIQKELTENKKNLFALIKKTYLLGKNPSIKLFLNNNEPSVNDRYLTYTRYLAEEQKELIDIINKKRNEVQNKKEELQLKQKEVIKLKDKYQVLKSDLENEKQKYQNKVIKLETTIDKERRELKETEVALKNLENEITRRQKDLADKRKQEALRQAQENISIQSGKTKKYSKEIKTSASYNLGLQTQIGSLPWPTKGSVIHAFGEKRSGEITWKGIVISANVDQSVTAIAAGECIYSGWLQGLGNIVVIDHGRGYLSLYGNNKKLNITSGDKVEIGQSIATLGNTGNFKTNSLYFEIRYEGIPVDPLKWLRKRR